MSQTIDTKIVEMHFKNSDFDKNVKSSVDSINGLKRQLNFSASMSNVNELSRSLKNVNVDTLGNSIDAISNKFSLLSIAGITMFTNLVNSAFNAGKQIFNALFIDPIKSGKSEYETQMNSIQTILANTQKEGTNLKDVNEALDELNAYSDKTIYNFTEMARNIGTFTAAGVKLDTSVAAIKGIANLAAVSGSNSQQASTAMYQLSQALATGTVRLMDWNSVVNAGMGGAVFQDALTETARAHGVAVDTIIKQEGSFRDSLSKGWLTADILNETLAKFTGDLTADQLRTMGYTEEQIQKILVLGKTASDAATKVKTFTQLFDTLKEAATSGWAQTWRLIIGDFEQAREFMTELNDLFGGIIGSMSETRNNLLKAWSDLGGRSVLIDSVRRALENIVIAAQPIADALKEIFPPITAQRLYTLTQNLRLFIAKLKMGEASVEKFKRIFKGLFSVIDIIRMALVAIGQGVGRLLKEIAPVGSKLFDTFADVGDFFTNLRNIIKEGDVFGKFINGLVDIIIAFKNKSVVTFGSIAAVVQKFIETFKTKGFAVAFGEGLKSFFDIVKSASTSGIENLIERLKERFEGFAKVFDGLKRFFDTIKAKFAPAFATLKKIKDALGQALSNFFVSILDKIANFDPEKFKFDSVFDAINTGLLSVLLLFSSGFVKKGSGFFDSIIDIFKGVKEVITGGAGTFGKLTEILEGVRGGLQAWQQSLRSDILLKIAAAIAILTISLIALSMIDSKKLTVAIVAITSLFAQLAITMNFLSTKTTTNVTNTASLLAVIMVMSGAILVLAGAVSMLARLDVDELTRGVAAIAVLAGVMVTTSMMLSGSAPQMVKGAFGMIVFAGSLLVLSTAVKAFGNIDTDTLTKGLVGVGIALAQMALFSAALNTTGFSPAQALSIIVMSGAILILSKAVTSLGGMSWESLGVAMVGLAGTLGILAVALNAMSTTLTGSASLLVAAGAIMILAPALVILGNLSFEQIGMGMLAIAAAFTVLGLAGYILTPVIPSLLGLGAAIGLLGIATLAAGAGVLMFATGLGLLAVSGAAGAAALVLILTSIVKLLPSIATSFGNAIVSLAESLANGSESLKESFITIGRSILSGISIMIPEVVDTFLTMLIKILDGIEEKLPDIIESGVNIVTSFLQGIRDNIGNITQIAFDIVTNFMDAITLKLPELITSGWELILSYINGLSEAVVTYTPQLMVAVQDLGLAILEGLITGMFDGQMNLQDALGRIGTIVIDGIKNALGIHSPADTTIPLGFETIQGFVNGMIDAALQLPAFIINMVTGIVTAMSSAILQFVQVGATLVLRLKDGILSKIGEVISTGIRLANTLINEITGRYSSILRAGQNFVQGFINGIKSYLNNAIAAATNLAQSVLNTVYNILGIESPSTEGFSAGRYVDEGLGNGIKAYAGYVTKEVTNLSNIILDGFNQAITEATDYFANDLDTNPVITPVLDLDDLKRGGEKINKMLGRKRALDVTPTTKALTSVAKSMAATSSSTSGDQAQASVATPVIQYVQNNYSPKALSSIDVYKETKKQLSNVGSTTLPGQKTGTSKLTYSFANKISPTQK